MEYRSRSQQQQQQQQREEDGMGYINNNSSLPPQPAPPPHAAPMRGVSAFSKPSAAPTATPVVPVPVVHSNDLHLISPRSAALPLRSNGMADLGSAGSDRTSVTDQILHSRRRSSPDPLLLLPITTTTTTNISSSSPPPPPPAVKYKECVRNHAASVGGHVLDGCGEYMAADETDSAMKCAACGCHRSFHRRETDQASDYMNSVTSAMMMQQAGGGGGGGGSYYRRDHHRMLPVPLLLPPPHHPSSTTPHHHHHHVMSHNNYKQQFMTPAFPPSPSGVAIGGNNNSGSGATTESSSEDRPPANQQQQQQQVNMNMSMVVSTKKRFRTKFTTEQKEKMLAFAERVGWRFHKQDEAVVQHFCSEVGVRRQVLKVWMHNNKHTIKKQQQEQELQLQLQQQQNQQHHHQHQPLEM